MLSIIPERGRTTQTNDAPRSEVDIVDPATGRVVARRAMEHWPTGRLLSAVTRRVERDWNAHLATWELNHASFPVLMHLLRGPRTQRELAGENKVTEQTMSRILDRLDRNGHVERGRDPADRRRRVVAITDEGRRVALLAAAPRRGDEIATRGLDPDQVEALRTLLIAMARVDEV